MCNDCGVGSEAYPLLTVAELSENVKDPVFKGGWDYVISLVRKDPNALKSFQPSKVMGRNIIGIKVEVHMAFVEQTEFLRRYKVPYTMVPGTRYVENVLVETGQRVTGIVMSLENMIGDLKYRRCVLFAESSNLVMEVVMSSQSQVRKEQGQDRSLARGFA